MQESLRDDIGKAYANVTGFMMLKIDLPNSYESAIVKTEVTNQEYTTYMTIRDVNLT